MRLPIVPLAVLALWVAAPAAAQRFPVGDPAEDAARLQALLDSAPGPSYAIRPLVDARDTARLSLLPLAVRLYANSAFPWGQDDGAAWRGKGATVTLEAGAQLRWRSVTLTVRPLVAYAQNAAFALAPDTVPSGYSPYGYPYHQSSGLRIDMPQRFGGAGFWTLDPGQTSLRVTGGRLMAGVGTENLWWGPGRRNAIILGNNAAGFPHALVGTSRPVSIGIGTIEAQWVWGRLTESDWFDTTAANDHRYFTGLAGTFQPQPFPGLVLGVTRSFVEYYPAGGLGLGDYFLVLQGITKKSQADSANPLGNDARDQYLSLFARWAPPGSGFEAYAEWSRNDHNWDLRDFLMEPEHSQGYTLGFQHVVRRGEDRLLRLQGELTHLERPSTFAVREVPTYYIHHIVRQGYTQRGQVLGAGVGPGGDAQFLGLEWIRARGRFGLGLLRQVRDNDALYGRYNFSNRVDSAGVIAFMKHDVTLGLLVNGAVAAGRWTVGGELGLLKDYNRYYLYRNDVSNLALELSLSRRF